MKEWIIDTDAGIDDAQALVLALNSPNFAVHAISTVSGNAHEDFVYSNVSQVLEVCNKQHIPIYRGCSRPILGSHIDAGYFHGKTGFGDYWDSGRVPPDRNDPQEYAPSMIARLGCGELNIICLGPLTNLAIAYLMNPKLEFNQVVVMGGTRDCEGNVQPTAEYNFYADPEAAAIVFKRAKHIVLVPWETTADLEVREGEFLERWLSPSPCGEFLRELTQYVIRREGATYLCDPMAVAVAIDESIIAESEEVHVKIETQGKWGRGQCILFRNKWGILKERRKHVKVVRKVHPERFHDLLVQSTSNY